MYRHVIFTVDPQSPSEAAQTNKRSKRLKCTMLVVGKAPGGRRQISDSSVLSPGLTIARSGRHDATPLMPGFGRRIDGRLFQTFPGAPVYHSERGKFYNHTLYGLNGAVGDNGYA
ncbi:hypothetical protein YTPLAS72_02900 [Nitrospira sp.]|nr:hypothetical protein YTPLAS72_02900 [Nitrospira sp.]